MRGQRERQQSMFVAFNIEERVPADHPLREIKRRCDRILASMSRDFDACYGRTGRVGIPPESMLKALLLRALFGIPSERRLCEACEFNVLYRWFLDWPLERPMWTPEAFSMNRERFERRALVTKFFERVVAEGLAEGLVGDDRFSVDGTLIRSLAGTRASGRSTRISATTTISTAGRTSRGRSAPTGRTARSSTPRRVWRRGAGRRTSRTRCTRWPTRARASSRGWGWTPPTGGPSGAARS